MIDSLVRVSRRDGEAVIMFQKKVQRQYKPSTTIKQSLICIHSINNNACIIQPLLRLTPPRFQVLFHSFFKVLFIFPSRYLFAIGLLNIFSL